MSGRKEYHSIDVAKFVAAIMIIVLHTAPFQSYSGALNYGMRNIVTVVAVPFFFITSGFLFFTKLDTLGQEEQHRYFIKYILRLITMYCLWSGVYFVFVATQWAQNGVTASDVLNYVRCFFFEGSYQTIWFLIALLSAITVVYYLRKKLCYRKILLIAIPFYVFACLGSSYYGAAIKIPVLSTMLDWYYSFFDSVKNGLLFGFVYVALGACMTQSNLNLKPKRDICLVALFYIAMAGETLLQTVFKTAERGVDTKLTLLPLSYFLFRWILSIRLPEGTSYVWLRKLSLLMFLSQRIFLTLFEWFLKDTIWVNNTMLYFVSILILTMAFSVVFILASEKIRILKKFY